MNESTDPLLQATTAPRKVASRFPALLARTGFLASLTTIILLAGLVLAIFLVGLHVPLTADWPPYIRLVSFITVILGGISTGTTWYGYWRVARQAEEFSAKDFTIDKAMDQTASILQSARIPLPSGCLRPLAGGSWFASIVLLALVLTPPVATHLGMDTATVVPTATFVSTATSIPPTATSVPPTATPIPPTATPIPPSQVTTIQAIVTTQPFKGLCTDPMAFTFSGTLGVSAGSGTKVTYHWLLSTGATTSDTSITFAGGSNQNVTGTLSLSSSYGNGQALWAQLVATSPNALYSSQVPFSFTCQLQPQRISLTSGFPANACNAATLTNSVTIAIAPHNFDGTLTLTWSSLAPGSLAPVTKTTSLAIPAGTTATKATDSLDVTGYGTYTETVTASDYSSVSATQTAYLFPCIK